MFWGWVNDLLSNCHGKARNQLEKGDVEEDMLIEVILFWSNSVCASDADLSMFSFAGYIIEPVESCILTELDAIDSIVLSTGDACWTIQLICHMLSSPDIPLQLPTYKPSSLLEQG